MIVPQRESESGQFGSGNSFKYAAPTELMRPAGITFGCAPEPSNCRPVMGSVMCTGIINPVLAGQVVAGYDPHKNSGKSPLRIKSVGTLPTLLPCGWFSRRP